MRARVAGLQQSIDASLPSTLAEGELLPAYVTLPLLGHMLRRIVSDTRVQHFHGTLTQGTSSLGVSIAPHTC